MQGTASAPTLFDVDSTSPAEIEEQWLPASKAVDSIIEKFGEGMIGPASSLGAIAPGQRRFGPLAED